MEIEIRKAEYADIEWVLSQLKKFAVFHGSKLSLYGTCEEYKKDLAKKFIDNHLFLIAEDSAKSQLGFVFGTLGKHFLNPEITVLSEVFWWVDEEKRSSGVGSALMHEFIAFGKENANWITFTTRPNTPVNENLLIRNGFRHTEKSYLLEVS